MAYSPNCFAMRAEDSTSAPDESMVRPYLILTISLAVALATVVVVMLCWRTWVVDPWAARVRTVDDHGYAVPGAFGDSFAPVVGAISSLALGAAIASLFLQRRELAFQRRALKEQRAEMQASNDAFLKQYDVMREQVEEQRRANLVADVAARLSATQQLIQIDQVGPMAVKRTIEMIDAGSRPQILRRATDLIWMELALLPEKARKENPTYLQLAKHSGEVGLLLDRHDLINDLVRKINRAPKSPS